MVMSSNIFNTEKKNYKEVSLFLGEQHGLFDSINKQYPKLWSLYKKLKALNWDENEFSFSSCNLEFKTVPKNVRDIMIRTLAWQWEADSVAANHVIAILAPYVSSTELTCYLLELGSNEAVHGLTYSEIVRNSFDNPDDVLKEILSVNESISRMETISSIFEKAYQTSHKLALGQVDKNQETFNDAFMMIVALYALERIQFMASFAITFAVAETGVFIPIATAVQKILQEEFEIHSQGDKVILDYLLQTEYGLNAFSQCREQVIKLINEVVACEFSWLDNLFSEGRELAGVDAELMKKWVLFNSKEVYDFFSIRSEHVFPTKNPLPYMDEWMNINAIQASPQEDRDGAYMVGGITTTTDGKTFDVEDL
jgi:ribonucleoside-diphosphate reductase beta chain